MKQVQSYLAKIRFMIKNYKRVIKESLIDYLYFRLEILTILRCFCLRLEEALNMELCLQITELLRLKADVCELSRG